nr:T9SS type A sorting domain-containing protein [Bacteroidota bacterium]
MKKLSVLMPVLLLFAFHRAEAQEYHPLIEANKYWDNDYWPMAAICPGWAHRHFYTGEDTLIDGQLWAKFSYFDFLSSNPAFCGPYFADTIPQPGYFLHEDTASRQVYFKTHPLPGIPELLYDFSLEVGDSYVSDWTTGGYELIVAEIGYIELSNGEMRKYWSFEDDYGTEYWPRIIEGIGMESGLFQDMIQFEWHSSLWCVQKDEIQLFGNECYGYVGEKGMDMPSTFHIYPNPAKGYFRLIVPANIQSPVVTIYDLTGRVMLEGSNLLKDAVIDITGLAPGIYMVVIGSGDLVWNEKLLIR